MNVSINLELAVNSRYSKTLEDAYTQACEQVKRNRERRHQDQFKQFKTSNKVPGKLANRPPNRNSSTQISSSSASVKKKAETVRSQRVTIVK